MLQFSLLGQPLNIAKQQSRLLKVNVKFEAFYLNNSTSSLEYFNGSPL